jgi:hypothetical protein
MVAIAGIALTGAILSLTSATHASAAVTPAPSPAFAHIYGPYSAQGTCNYWMYGVRAGGGVTTDCYYQGPYGWYFIQY